MNREYLTLLELLRLSLFEQNECCYSKFEDVNWAAILKVAIEQEVVGICIDGIERLPKEIRPQQDILLHWIGVAASIEALNQGRFQSAVELADLWASEGIRTLVMKGLSIGRLYPNPLHRQSCDMDVFLVHKEQSEYKSDSWSAWAEGNKIMESKGIKVNKEYYRNSSFDFYGLHVENHRYCTYVKGSKRGKRYELLLRKLLTDETTSIQGNLEAPCDIFVALHTLSHAQGHFLSEGITLKHLCDWAVILHSFKGTLDWKSFVSDCKEYGVDKFLFSISRLTYLFFGISLPFDCGENQTADMMLLEDMFSISEHKVKGKGGLKRRVGYAIQKLRSSWKYRNFSDKPMIVALLQQVYGYLFEANPKLV